MADVMNGTIGTSWFVALPDDDGAATVAGALRAHHEGLLEVTHPSGRPWLVGRWTATEAVSAELGSHRLAVIGEHLLTAGDLHRLGAGARDAAELCSTLRDVPGSFHVVAATPDAVQLHGTLSGLRRVFHGRAGAVTIAGDRADVVAELIHAEIDDDRLAVRLMSPIAPWPMSWQPVWRGVHAVAPDERLVVPAASAGAHTVRRWQPPPATLGLADAGAALRHALSEAVRVRTASAAIIASDLSGMDSTSLCCLAATGGQAEVVALTCVSTDPMDNDLPWARQTVQLLGTVTHEVIPAEEYPVPYDGFDDLADRFDEPSAVVMYRAGFLALSHRALEHGARVRLSGFGGDELLLAEPALQVTMLRSDPVRALRHLRFMRAGFRWSRRTTLRALMDRRTYPDWLASLAPGLGVTSAASLTEPALGWGLPVHVAPWVTSATIERARRALTSAAEQARPVVDNPGRHSRMVTLYAGASAARHFNQMTTRAGLATSFPYYDDQVVQACLSAALPAVTDPRDYKPVLRAAMGGVVPEPVRARRDKADTTIATEQSALDHRDRLATLADDSRLAARGLIDPRRLRSALITPDQLTWSDLDQTLACETWLRTVEASPIKEPR